MGFIYDGEGLVKLGRKFMRFACLVERCKMQSEVLLLLPKLLLVIKEVVRVITREG